MQLKGVSFGAFFCASILNVTFLTSCFLASNFVSFVFFLTTLLNAKDVSSLDSDSVVIGSMCTFGFFLFLPFSETTSINALMSSETFSTNLLAFPFCFSLFFWLNYVSTSCDFCFEVPQGFSASSIGASINILHKHQEYVHPLHSPFPQSKSFRA